MYDELRANVSSRIYRPHIEPTKTLHQAVSFKPRADDAPIENVLETFCNHLLGSENPYSAVEIEQSRAGSYLSGLKAKSLRVQ